MHSAGAMAAPGPGWDVRGPTGQPDGPRSGVQPAPFLGALGDAVGPSHEAQVASAPRPVSTGPCLRIRVG